MTEDDRTRDHDEAHQHDDAHRHDDAQRHQDHPQDHPQDQDQDQDQDERGATGTDPAGADAPRQDGPPAQAHALPHVTGAPAARWVSAPVPRRRPARWALVAGAAATAALVLGGTGAGAWSLGRAVGETAAVTATERQVQGLLPSATVPGTDTGTGGTDGASPSPWQGGSGPTGSGTPGTTDQQQQQQQATAATAEEQRGVVTIESALGYEGTARSAGTGMVLTADGLVLTNAHVVHGATSIAVTDETTGREYVADVVGTDATADVAVLQLRDASGLDTVAVDDDGDPAVGDAVHSTGNAEGTGDLVTAQGEVLATDQAITVADEADGTTESLGGLLEFEADVVAGDSGGPLRDDEGEVVGLVTAASSGGSPTRGYAIPVDDALSLARQIEAGEGGGTVQIGLPAFLGVQVAAGASTTTGGVAVAGTVEGSAAATAGLAAGDVVTSVDGTPVATADELTAAVRAHEAGDRAVLGWTDATGTARTATVVLGTGPAA